MFHLRYIQGQQLALVGYFRSGKNIIIQLLTRFYDIENGEEEILIIVMLHVLIREKKTYPYWLNINRPRKCFLK